MIKSISNNDSKAAPSLVTLEKDDGIPTARHFYDSHVRLRRPMLIRQQCPALLHNPNILHQLGSAEQLLELVGMEDVEQRQKGIVEVNVSSSSSPPTTTGTSAAGAEKTSPTNAFSPLHGSRVVEMPLAEFCARLQAGSNEYYMTTQTLPLDEEGRPAVYNWLTKELLRRNILPLRPAILGNLIPMNAANVWMGRTDSSSASSSSGLHHDMHDNLYCLLLGEKTVRIAPPSAVKACKMVGKLHTLHENGRIVYHEQLEGSNMNDNNNNNNNNDGECPIRPDGALVSVERILQLEVRKDAVEQELATISDDGNEAKREDLEEQLNAIEEELLDIEMACTDGGVEDATTSEDDDEDPSTLFGSAKQTSQADFVEGANTSKRLKVIPSLSSSLPCNEKGRTSKNSIDSRTTSSTTTPPNFVLQESDQIQFQSVHLQAGDALYLPAGWLHEVFSHGDGRKNGIHMAINYWVHPPDVGPETCFERPYRSAFWQRDWDARRL